MSEIEAVPKTPKKSKTNSSKSNKKTTETVIEKSTIDVPIVNSNVDIVVEKSNIDTVIEEKINSEINNDEKIDENNDNEEKEEKTKDKKKSIKNDITNEDFNNIMKQLIECYDNLNKSNLKELEFDKDISKDIQKIITSHSKLVNSLVDFAFKEGSNAKIPLKQKRKVSDPSKAAMNIYQNTYPEVLKFIYRNEKDKVIDPNEEIRKADIQRSINNYMKIMKEESNNFTIIEQIQKNGKSKKVKSYEIQGDLLELFKFIKKESSNRGETFEIPKSIMHTDIMKFLKYFVHTK